MPPHDIDSNCTSSPQQTEYERKVYWPSYLAGVQYEDWLCDQLEPHGFKLQKWAGRRGNFIGENTIGLEIKLDRWLKITGNIWIEVDEKSDPSKPTFFPSGIRRQDNSISFGIGNYDQLFIFDKAKLEELYASGEFKLRTNKYESGHGFLIKKDRARQECQRYFWFGRQGIFKPQYE